MNTDITDIENTDSTLWKQRFEGIGTSDGIAIGRVVKREAGLPSVPDLRCTDTDVEISRFESACTRSLNELAGLIHEPGIGKDQKAIFEAHQMMIMDPVMGSKVKDLILNHYKTAARAWFEVISEYHGLWIQAGRHSRMGDRTTDIIDIGQRVLSHMGHKKSILTNLPPDSILITEELSATDALTLHQDMVAAVVSCRGNDTSHSAILLKGKGIPAVFGVEDLFETLSEGELVIVDGTKGIVYTGNSDAFIARMNRSRSNHLRRIKKFERHYKTLCHVADGSRIYLLANISSPDQIEDAIRVGAEGIGLFRTEFLYFNSRQAPHEDDQYSYYTSVLKKAAGRPVTFRTADFGGDKPLSYLDLPSEANPFLGLRGIRFSLEETDLFKTQLRALYRASALAPISVMYPMISTVDEVLEVKKIAAQVENELMEEGISTGKIQHGIMVEVPSVVVMIHDFLPHVDFVSIGTNDLTQYVMAADRGNPAVRKLASADQPAVRSMISRTIQEANAQGIPVSICGEMAGESRFTKFLVESGLRYFSMSADRIPVIKSEIISYVG